MALGVWLFLGLAMVVATGCQGDYPIAATACDEWCEATKGMSCGYDDPASCVSLCESQNITHTAECQALFDAALSCYELNPSAASYHCTYNPSPMPAPCDAEMQAMLACVSNYSPY